MDLIEIAKEIGLNPVWTSSHGRGEYHCACPNPKCDADDNGFAIWPNEPTTKCVGRYWCRKCDSKGDTIQFCRDFLGLSWEDACEKLNVKPGEFQSTSIGAIKKPEKTPKLAKAPAPLWQEKATVFVDWCYQQLMKTSQALDQIMQRGFTLEAIERFKLGYCPQRFKRKYEEWGMDEEGELTLHRGFVIPWIDSSGKVLKIKVRSDTYENDVVDYENKRAGGKEPKWKPQKYLYVKGSMRCPAVYGDQSLKVGILTESEFDGMLIQQQCGVHVFSIANGGSKQPIDFATDHLIRKSQLILLCPDDDEGGDFLLTLLDTYSNMKLWPAPVGKSPGDALKDHKVNLRQWILQGIPPALRNQPPQQQSYEFTCPKCGCHSYWISIFNDTHCVSCVSPKFDETLVKTIKMFN